MDRRNMVPVDVESATGAAMLCVFAGAISEFIGTATVVSLAIVSALWPLLLLLPARWKDRITEGDYLRAGARLVVGPPCLAVVAAWATSQSHGFPVTAVVLGAGAMFFAVVRLTLRRASWRSQRFDVVAGAFGAIVGMLVDRGLGWHSLAYALYAYSSCGASRELLGLTRPWDVPTKP